MAAAASIAALGLLLGLALGLALVDPPDPAGFPVSPILLDRSGAILHVTLSSDDEWAVPERLSDMGRWLPLVAVSIEDRRFSTHHGVDPLALARAAWQNLSSLRVVSGASTITVQLVRLSRPRPRTMASKLVEFLEAVRLDAVLTKSEILELYLNRAPFGGNIRGVGAAARIYFGKSPRDLSLGESATLVALLRGPSIYRPDRRPALAAQRRDFILDLLVARGAVPAGAAEAAKTEIISSGRHPLPGGAPHLAARLLAESDPRRWRWGAEGFSGLPSTIDPAGQILVERALARALEGRSSSVTGAGVLMDARTGEALAYVGAGRPDGPARFVDHARARRSAGSTLKPFIYLAAFTETGLGPESLLADTPLGFGGQAPRNFDGGFRGPVQAGRALAESLNAPAVRVARLVGERRSLEILRAAGLRPAAGRDYGDSLILGGVEATLLELVGAYGILARGGRDGRLVFEPVLEPVLEPVSKPVLEAGLESGLAAAVPAAPSSSVSYPPPAGTAGAPAVGTAAAAPGGAGSTVGAGTAAGPAAARRPPFALDPAGVWLVNLSLRDERRLPAGLRGDDLAFKTGTSHGFRDAWILVWTPDHVLGLWLGDPSGRPHAGLSGLDALAPAAVSVMRALGPAAPWPGPPSGVERYRACPVTGEPVSPNCPDFKWAWRAASTARTMTCRLHVLRGGEVVRRWPSDLAGAWPGARAAEARPARPLVVSPADGAVFRLAPGADRIPLRSEGAMGLVRWYLDGEFVGAARPGSTPVVALTPGEHRVGLMDERELTAESGFTVVRLKGEGAPILVVR